MSKVQESVLGQGKKFSKKVWLGPEEIRPMVEQAFISSLDKTSSGCWNWKSHMHTDSGYGSFTIPIKVTFLAHRVSWSLFRGEMGDKLVLHKCDNKKCVNPSHLFLGTHKDNIQDAITKGRWWTHRGARNGSAKLSAAKVKKIRSLARFGMSQKDIASKFSVSLPLINKIVRRTLWTWVQ